MVPLLPSKHTLRIEQIGRIAPMVSSDSSVATKQHPQSTGERKRKRRKKGREGERKEESEKERGKEGEREKERKRVRKREEKRERKRHAHDYISQSRECAVVGVSRNSG